MCCVPTSTYLFTKIRIVSTVRILKIFGQIFYIHFLTKHTTSAFIFISFWLNLRRILYFAFIGRMGERTGKADNKIRKGNADEKET